MTVPYSWICFKILLDILKTMAMEAVKEFMDGAVRWQLVQADNIMHFCNKHAVPKTIDLCQGKCIGSQHYLLWYDNHDENKNAVVWGLQTWGGLLPCENKFVHGHKQCQDKRLHFDHCRKLYIKSCAECLKESTLFAVMDKANTELPSIPNCCSKCVYDLEWFLLFKRGVTAKLTEPITKVQPNMVLQFQSSNSYGSVPAHQGWLEHFGIQTIRIILDGRDITSECYQTSWSLNSQHLFLTLA